MISQKKVIDFNECTYWSHGKKECLLCKGGLFIPMPDHIAAYCQKESFSSCPYLMSATTLPELKEEYNRPLPHSPAVPNNWVNRVKQPESLPLKIVAQTLDYGIGGMRILINQKLPGKGLVSFSLGIDPESNHIDKGEISWIRKTAEMISQVGISFIEKNLTRSV